MQYLGYIASILMGVVLGVMGGGGSILTVPILVYIFALSPLVATGYSLFVVGTTALIGSIMYVRNKDVDFQAGFAFAIPSVIGVNISRGLIIPNIPDAIAQLDSFVLTKEILIMTTFAALMIAASYSMIKKQTNQKQTTRRSFTRFAWIALQGLVIGVIAGFVGAGGGFLIIPALVLIAGLNMRKAIGTSLVIIAVQSLLGFVGDLSRGFIVDWSMLLVVTAFSIIGIALGFSVAHKIKEQKLKITFGWFILIMGTVIFLEQLSRLSSK